MVDLSRTLRLAVVLRGREGEVLDRISIHQHPDLNGTEDALNRIKTQGAVVDVDLGSNMYSLISKVFCNFLEMVSSSVTSHEVHRARELLSCSQTSVYCVNYSQPPTTGPSERSFSVEGFWVTG